MLTQVQKDQLTQLAQRDFEDGVSRAGSIYKMVEERDGWEKAEEAIEFYCKQQKDCIDTLEAQADAHEYQMMIGA